MNFSILNIKDVKLMHGDEEVWGFDNNSEIAEVEEFAPISENTLIKRTNFSEVEFSGESSFVHWELLNKLAAPQNHGMVDLEREFLVQCRRHKKKRINKKWAKRYGYKLKKVRSSGWHYKSFDNGQLTISREYDDSVSKFLK